MIYKFNFIEKILIANDIIPHPFADIGNNVGLAKALGTAVKLKLTDHLSVQPKSTNIIAKEAKVSEKGVELVLDCLTALGYTKKTSGGYCYTKRGDKVLNRKSPLNMLYFIEFCDWTFNSFSTLEDTIRNGKPSKINLEHFTEYQWEIFSRAMIDIAKTNLKEVVSKIRFTDSTKSIMDLGGSHGLYSIMLCEKYKNLSATILDFEPVKKYMDECVVEKKMQDRVTFKVCNFAQDELLHGQDGALLFNIIHGFSDEQNNHLFKKVYDSLNTGGQLIVLDQIKGIGGNSQLSMATTSFMAINLFHQANGNTYSFKEVSKWSYNAGFTKIKLAKLHAPGFGIITCEK